jgi:integrase
MALTDLKVRKAGAGRYSDGAGLHLLVADTGGKSWLLRIQHAGRRRDLGLGSLADYTLAEARERARDCRKWVREGHDPKAWRRQGQSAIPTFEDAARACHKAKASGWTERHAAAFLSTLQLHIFPKLGALRVDTITERDVAAALGPIWLSKPAAGRKLRQRVGLVLDYAKASGWRAEAAPRSSLSSLLAKQATSGNFLAMAYAELPAFIAKVEGEAETVGRLALLFTILTACRNGEAREARWSHIDFDAGEWRRPASLMRKTGKAHSVTLSPEALAILGRAKRWKGAGADPLVFPGKGGKPLSDMTLSKIVRPTGFTVHGFRSTFKTWAVERMPSIPEPVSEAALAHLVPDKVERAYNRAKFLDLRRTLLDAWGRYVTGASSDVVQLPLQLRG